MLTMQGVMRDGRDASLSKMRLARTDSASSISSSSISSSSLGDSPLSTSLTRTRSREETTLVPAKRVARPVPTSVKSDASFLSQLTPMVPPPPQITSMSSLHQVVARAQEQGRKYQLASPGLASLRLVQLQREVASAAKSAFVPPPPAPAPEPPPLWDAEAEELLATLDKESALGFIEGHADEATDLELEAWLCQNSSI